MWLKTHRQQPRGKSSTLIDNSRAVKQYVESNGCRRALLESPHWTKEQPQAEFRCEHLQVPGIWKQENTRTLARGHRIIRFKECRLYPFSCRESPVFSLHWKRMTQWQHAPVSKLVGNLMANHLLVVFVKTQR
eukprot:COSAG02_NODE_789_length_17189_cov_23.034114_4_plen_133_part_00